MRKVLLILTIAWASFAQAQYVTTIAGKPGTSGWNQGSDSLKVAEFANPYGIAIDASSQIWVSEYMGNRIRLISGDLQFIYTRSGPITDPATSGGYKDGSGIVARYNGASGIDIGTDGVMYIADRDNHCIRKLSAYQNVGLPQTSSTFAGSTVQVAGYKNGTGTAAEFTSPTDVCVDKDNNVYVADFANHCIRKITPAGVVTLFAGTPGTAGYNDGAANTAEFDLPKGLCYDKANGAIIVADYNNARIRKIIISTGVVSTIAGSGNAGSKDGNALSAEFGYPVDVCIDDKGGILIVDGNSSCTIRYLYNGKVSTVAGEYQYGDHKDGIATKAWFYNPAGIAFNTSQKIAYVADELNHCIRKLDLKPAANFVATITNPAKLTDVIFHNLTPGLNAINTFKWTISGTEGVDFNLNGGTLNDSSIKVQFLKNGLYTVTLECTNNFGTGTITKKDYINVGGTTNGIADIQSNHTFGIFPNPSNDGNIIIENNQNIKFNTLMVSDMNGRVVYIDNNNPYFRNFHFGIGLGELQKGMYIITLTDGISSYRQKLILQ